MKVPTNVEHSVAMMKVFYWGRDVLASENMHVVQSRSASEGGAWWTQVAVERDTRARYLEVLLLDHICVVHLAGSIMCTSCRSSHAFCKVAEEQVRKVAEEQVRKVAEEQVRKVAEETSTQSHARAKESKIAK